MDKCAWCGNPTPTRRHRYCSVHCRKRAAKAAKEERASEYYSACRGPEPPPPGGPYVEYV